MKKGRKNKNFMTIKDWNLSLQQIREQSRNKRYRAINFRMKQLTWWNQQTKEEKKKKKKEREAFLLSFFFSTFQPITTGR